MGTGWSSVLLAIHPVVVTFVPNLSDNLVYIFNFSDLFQEVQGFETAGTIDSHTTGFWLTWRFKRIIYGTVAYNGTLLDLDSTFKLYKFLPNVFKTLRISRDF